MNVSSRKVCIVTGGSAGIGLATAKRFLNEGYRVCICGRRKETLDSAANLLGFADSVLTVCGDVSGEQVRKNLLTETLNTFGRIDVLVNNAGAAPLGDFSSINKDIFESVLNTNVRAVFELTQSVWKHMVADGGGNIVNISSLAAIDPFPGFSIYGASKAWLETFTKAIAAEGEAHQIRVCGVRPGAVETDLLRGLFPDFPAEECVSPDAIANKVWQCVADPTNHPSGESFTVSK
jgi:NAD(P)-dependent dehydrogenase (short-subunit alcohol dehydrogenase family)